MCTRTSDKLKNTLSKQAGTSSRCTPLARIYDNSNAEFHKNTYFLRSLSAVIQVYTTTSACVCENATTVVEITSARRTHFTMRRRPSDVEGATRNAIRSQTRDALQEGQATPSREGKESCIRITHAGTRTSNRRCRERERRTRRALQRPRRANGGCGE